MPAYRFPILVWQDFAGGFTSTLLDENVEATAAGESMGDVVEQLKDYLQWLYKEHPWMLGPDFQNPRLLHIKVEVRPEYEVETRTEAGKRKRVYACEEPVSIRVACVCGTDAAGLLVCAMPLLGGRFTYYDPTSLKGLVTHYVQSRMKGLTPMEMARQLPPAAMTLDEIVIQTARETREKGSEPALKALNTVAEPLGMRGLRRQLSRPWERDAEVARLTTLLGKEKASAILVGESGSGKTAVLAETVRKVEREKPEDQATDDRPAHAARHRFWLTSAARLIAGMRYLGQWQQRCGEVIEELSQIEGVLCIENLLDLLRTGGESPADSLAAFFLPYLQRGELRLVGEVTPAELDTCRRLLPGFADLFQIVKLPVFTRQQAVSGLSQVAQTQSKNVRVGIEAGVIEQVYRLYSRFMPYQGFPGQSASFVVDLFERALRSKAIAVNAKQVIEQFVRRTGLPELFLRDEIPLRREQVFDTISKQVIGQDLACRSAADLILTFKAGLNDTQRPIGVLLFRGPTGVGKTELAKAISNYFFGHGEQKDRLIRLDMSEYAGPGAADRLLGARQAQLGPRGEPSPLIRRVRQQPFGVLLLDEIEKASPEVFDMLLGVFDEGRLTDPYGRLTTFRSTIIIMTSNLGADRPEAFGLSKSPPASDKDMMGFFRPEFYNRIDAVVHFEPLSPAVMLQITEKELRELSTREGFTRANLKLTWTADLVTWLAARGYDRRYGARPLQRAIETSVVAPVAKYLIDHPEMRDATLHIDRGEGDAVRLSTSG